MKSLAATYLRKFSEETNLIADAPSPDLKLSVVVPALDEDLDNFLQHLSKVNLRQPKAIEVIVVINHTADASESLRAKHWEQFVALKRAVQNSPLKTHLLYREFPAGRGGVGMARKYGMDEALRRFAEIDYNGMLVCLDADCRVSDNYFNSLMEAEAQGWKGLSTYYEHPIENLDSSWAICRYEIFLRYYALALQRCGYYYPFQTVGSSMAVRADAYCRAGGMNKRKAGEDFYFLHRVFPQGQFCSWTECTVYPSARLSRRVPFGTGRAMQSSLSGEKDYRLLYNPEIFKVIGRLCDFPDTGMIPRELQDFFQHKEWLQQLQDLRERSGSVAGWQKNFRYWLDGFKILKVIHYLKDYQYGEVHNISACAQYLETRATDEYALLEELRRLEKNFRMTYI